MKMHWTLILLLGSSLAETTWGWTYHYSNKTMTWDKARKYCRDNYKDMVVIQSQEENDYLVSLLPNRAGTPYYWIGITKTHMNETWTWLGNNSTWVGNESWAENEPNNNHRSEFCVEIYINLGKHRGKWSDEKCSLRKSPACYKAQCNDTACGRGTCRETINSITCHCEPGFKGDRCQTAIACEPLLDPEQGSHQCFCPYGSNRFNSSCSFHCELGFRLVGAPQLLCQTSGHWNHRFPLCQVEQCPVLNHTNSSGGQMNCSHPIAPYSYNSTCEVRCDEGYGLSGDGHISCDHTGQWTASLPACTAQCNDTVCGRGTCRETINSITCHCEPGFKGDRCQTVVECPHPPRDNGDLSCSEGNQTFNSTCQLKCHLGFMLTGLSTITCGANGDWSGPIPICTSYKHALLAVVGCGALSAVCCVCCCWMKRRKRKKLAQGRQPEEVTCPSSEVHG